MSMNEYEHPALTLARPTPSRYRMHTQPHALVKPHYELVKRAIDIVASLIMLIIAAPVIALCAVAIWITDPGPIFFAQRRTGLGGRRFSMYKLRTMVENAAELKADLVHLNSRTGPDFKIEFDPRVTPIGRTLRRASLDELPQLYNVLRGDMSLVGPRPTSFPIEQYSLWHTARLEVRPGVTGLWQVEARHVPDFDSRIRLDIEYIERRSLALDLWILGKTMGPVLSGRGAT
jgi:lipopolysaccharide/colanic/teichoic acid biosynthesis glycosyltransferase